MISAVVSISGQREVRCDGSVFSWLHPSLNCHHNHEMISDLITQLYVIRKVNMKYIKCKMKWSGAGRGRKNINTLCVCELSIINCLWCLCWAVQTEFRPRLTTRKVVRTAVAAWSVVTAVCLRRTRDHHHHHVRHNQLALQVGLCSHHSPDTHHLPH